MFLSFLPPHSFGHFIIVLLLPLYEMLCVCVSDRCSLSVPKCSTSANSYPTDTFPWIDELYAVDKPGSKDFEALILLLCRSGRQCSAAPPIYLLCPRICCPLLLLPYLLGCVCVRVWVTRVRQDRRRRKIHFHLGKTIFESSISCFKFTEGIIHQSIFYFCKLFEFMSKIHGLR